jgi:(1->4)-alpha-D-glucan 1-alpha-D-glucosylmutase
MSIDTAQRSREAPARRYSTPRASYRVQLHKDFTFDDVRARLPYFDALGVSHLYFSPIFTAAPGSTHGYDVFDHGQINPELGGISALYALGEELLARDMGLIVDMVPNHVGLATSANPWWRDLLRYGEGSRYANFFDVNWSTQPHLPSGVVVYPILGQPFGAALEAGELRLILEDHDLALAYYEHHLPLAPASYPDVIGLPPLDLRAQLTDPAALGELLSVLDGLRAASGDDAGRLLEQFRRLLAQEPALADYVASRLAALNGTVGDPASFDQLEAILLRQHYRLAFWRVSSEDINYRRFFDINELAAIRVEREDVFEETHRLLLSLVEQGLVTGVRIDHVDGLYDPGAYLQRLRDRLREAATCWTDQEIPIYVEKILEEGEPLPTDWPVAGTTGYDFMAHNDGLFIERGAVLEMTRTYERFVGEPVRFRQLRYDAKKQIARTSFAGEVNVLATALYTIAQRDRRQRDNTLRTLRNAIEAVLAAFPVYRTYIVDGRGGPDDRELIETAVAGARRHDRNLSTEAIDFLAEVLLLDGTLDPAEYEQRLQFRRKFQQLSSPVMAKGFEDTTFYRYNRLLSLNEVGSDPSLFGAAPEEVQAWFADRAAAWPRAMSASSTHDTKRSEDARARLHVLSEIFERWRDEVNSWAEMNADYRATIGGEPVPDPNTEYLLYQALVASWPEAGTAIDDAYRTRIAEYLTKAMREMKTYTSWTNTDERVEGAAQEFLTAILASDAPDGFPAKVGRFVASIEAAALRDSLAMLIIKGTAPGFPDFYQGTELWDRSLTDPDNRRPVDYDARERLLHALPDVAPTDLASPAMKLWVTRRLLALRGEHAALFEAGSYTALAASGEHAANVFAFARQRGDTRLVVVVPRLTTQLVGLTADAPLGAAWDDTTLPLPEGGTWRNAFTGETVMAKGGSLALADLFATFPFAILTATETKTTSNSK